jgi:glutathione synthase
MIERMLILVSQRRQMAFGNHVLYANALLRRGLKMSIGDINSIHARQYLVKVNAIAISEPLSPGDRLDWRASTPIPVTDFDLVWVMNGPHPALAMDAWQLLWMAQTTTPFVNTVEALLLLRSKNVLGVLAPPANLIPTHVDSRCEDLLNIFDVSDHDWVVKPSNFGAGGDVFLVRKGDSNARGLLQSATGNVHVYSAMMDPALLGLKRRFCVLQRFEPHAQTSEKRVLIAGGEPFAQYHKVPAPGEHRANNVYGSKEEHCELSPDEQTLCATVGKSLTRHGVRFAGIDLAYPYIFEVNIINPGGTGRAMQLSGKDVPDRGVDLIFKYFEGTTKAPGRQGLAVHDNALSL